MMPTTIRRLMRGSRNNYLAWRYLFNLAPTLSYRLSSRSIDSEAASVVADLNRDGVAMTSVQALLGPGSNYNELSRAADKLEKEMAGDLAAARARADDSDGTGHKGFILPLLGDYPALDPANIYARFALQKPMLQIASAYFGMYTRLRYYNIWHTLASQGQPRQSQLWHRDREDRYILKAFVYLSDVDDNAGPFTYARGTHLKGPLRQEPEHFLEGGVRRSDDRQMAAVASPECWLTCTGPKGTIVFADTHGYHKGGLARERDRVMYTCMFTSPASESEEFFNRPAHLPAPHDREQAFALAGPKPGPWLRLGSGN